MNDSKISVRYAKALFLAAQENGCEDAVRDDMTTILACLNSVQEFKALLTSPVVKDDLKIETFKKLFASKFNPLTIEFFNMLLKNKREEFLKIICLNYTNYYTKSKNIKQVSLVSAVEAGGDVRQYIKVLVERANPGCVVELETTTDQSLIGGLVVTVDGLRYDASVKHQLAQIKKKLM